MRIIPSVVLFLLFALLISCQPQVAPVTAESILQPSKGGDFRGIRLGDRPKLIKREEEASSVYSMPDELIFRMEPQEADSTWYEISYSFNQDGLNHISLDVFPQGADLEEHLFNEFAAYYTQRFGSPKTLSNQAEWRGLTTQGRFVTVSLLRKKASSHPTHLRLVFNETNP